MRINKYIASTGFCSRRKAEDVIKEGRVELNGEKVVELGTNVDEKNDVVTIDGVKIQPEQKSIYILLNKPEGYITSVKDQFDRPDVSSLVSDIPERIYPVGRLDYETSGLLIMTNDGELTQKLTHPKHEVEKVYKAIVKGFLTAEEIQNFKNGLEIEDYVTAPAKIRIVREEKERNRSIVEVKIHEGKNRQVRKMLRAINHPVLRLRRIGIGNIRDNKIEIGKYRHLTDEEVRYLKNI